ncbi:uncharacterized protein LOC135379042 isoform X3 [Ornithodoros turicata]|uniref:uncharacterized protein LOC135379042 isoform X3 n=1 Tax=Ornithodoros turicata TaxID=34597 RepID=UPI003139543E
MGRRLGHLRMVPKTGLTYFGLNHAASRHQHAWLNDVHERRTGPCGGHFLPDIYYDPPFSYMAITQYMWSNTLLRIAKEGECDKKHLDQCYQHLIPAYKDDLNRSLCYTTTDTQRAPTFSGVVGFNVDNFCKAAATLDGLTAGQGSTVSESCTTLCGVSGHQYNTNFLGPCKAPQTSRQACFDDDHVDERALKHQESPRR